MSLSTLKNTGPAALKDFALLGVSSRAELALCDADALYARLCALTGKRHDPCVHDVFAATIHEARTGERLDWWQFTPVRKARQKNGTFVPIPEEVRKN